MNSDSEHEFGYTSRSHRPSLTLPSDPVIEVARDKLQSIAYEVVNLIMLKNADYGDAWQRQGINGCLVRLADKLYRIENLADGSEALVVGDALEDSLRDAIGYALLGLLYLRECRK